MGSSIAFSLLCFLFQNTEVAFKPNEEFEVQIDYQFKQRPATDPYTVDFTETKEERTRKQYGGGVRPYLVLNIKLITLSELEFKARGINNDGPIIFNKKVKPGDFLKIDMGFTDDIKDRVGPYEMTVFFSSREKKETSRIHMIVEENGNFMVNGTIRGKF